jgi:VWFA-related protein
VRRQPLPLVLAVLVVAGMAATAATARQQPVFRTGANLVRVDVAVIDRSGKPVDALTADDFEIEEDGIAQTIQTLKFVEASGHPPPGDDRSLAIRSRSDIEMEAARDDVRVVVIFWDEYYIDRMASAIRARRFLTSFVESEVAPLDMVAVVDEFTPSDAIPFTRSRAELTAQIRALKGRRGLYVPPRNGAEEEHLAFMGSIERIRSEVTLTALQAFAVRLGGLREARKAIVFVSEGPSGLGSERFDRLRELTRAANDANVAIYTVDPRGLGQWRTSDILAEIAINTDGRAFQSNAPERLLGQVFRHLSSYYLLGYESTQRPQDGKFHKIDVRVRNRRVDVLARKGYWAPAAADLTRAREAAAAGVPAAVTGALSELAGGNGSRDIDLWIGTARDAHGAAEVTVTWAPSARQPRPSGPSGASVTATGADGRVLFEGPTVNGVVRFGAPSGPLKIRTLFFDTAGERIGDDTREVVVPDFNAQGLALGTPVVTTVTTPAARRGPAGPPLPGREFSRADRLLVTFEVHGAAAAAATVSAKLLDRTGSARVDLPVTPAGPAAAGGPFQIDLPLSFAAPADYLIAIAASSGDAKAEALVPIRVLNNR